MRRTHFAVAGAAMLVAVGLLADTATAGNAFSDAVADEAALRTIQQHPTADNCGQVPAGHARCLSKKRLDIKPGVTPSGFGPADLQSAYQIPAGGAGMTVALVDAFDDPNAESDLAMYRSQYGLPACTTANGCFKKVNQNGQPSPLPGGNAGWAGEIALDIEMVSAACPACNILLVEVGSDANDDLFIGISEAATLGAVSISNSWSTTEDSTITGFETQYLSHPGVMITAATGDTGFGVGYPASSAFAIAVGGTSLATSGSSRGWAETAWNGAGSGCSGFITKPTWQKDADCSMRMEADVSAIADPNTGVAEYDSSSGGWVQAGGTSAATPIVASIFAATSKTKATGAFFYEHPEAFYDVTSGSNGSCGGTYECTAGTGYDGPTGIGTPNGAILNGLTPCTTSATCPATKPICDPSTSTCRACTATDCTAPKSICETTGTNAGACVQCDGAHASACTGGTPICDTTGGTCRACTPADCTGAKPVCETAGTSIGACVQCDATNHTACTAASPVCNATTNTCGPCSSDADCSGQFCDTSTDGQHGQCVQCNTDAQCPNSTCVTSSHVCASSLADGGSPGDDGGGNGVNPGDQTTTTTCTCSVIGGHGSWGEGLAGVLLGLTAFLRRRRR